MRAFATARQKDLPADDGSVEGLLIGAADYLDLQPWKGDRKASTQGLTWPRLGVTFEGMSQDSIVPTNIRRAQFLLALEIQSGDLLPSVRPSEYKRTKVDVIYVEMNNVTERNQAVVIPAVAALIQPFLRSSTAAFKTIRA